MEISFQKLLEWVVGRDLELVSDEKSVKFEIKRMLTKKEYKLLLASFQNQDILEKLNLDSERSDKLLQSGKKKISQNLGKFAKI